MLRNIDSLTFVCTASMGFYLIMVFHTIQESSANFISSNWSSRVYYWRPSGVLQCLPIFSMALSCQMQLFEVLETMQTVSFDRQKKIIKESTAICTLVYILIGFFGYIAFLDQKFSGNILVNFTPSFASDIIKIGFVLSVACSFPLVIFPCRASMHSLLYRRSYSEAHYIPEAKFRPITLFIVLTTMVVALLLPSIEVIIGLIGSTIGVLICVMFPASLFVKITQKKTKEKMLAQILLLVGFLIMILGTYANLSAIDEASSGSHLEEKLSMENKNAVAFIKPPNSLEAIEEQINKIEKKEKSEKEMIKDKDKQEPRKLPVEAADISKDKSEQKADSKSVEVKELPKNKKNPDNSVKPESIPKIVNKDAILKEDREIVIEQQDQEIKDKKEEIKRLEETKSKLESDVLLDIKEELVKQNKETQDLVLQKFKEIEVKVDNIEKKNEEKNKPLEQSNPKEDEDSVDFVNLANDVHPIETKNEPAVAEEINLQDSNLKEIKDELTKQNKETQDLVLQKLEEIEKKVQKIEEKNEEKPKVEKSADLEKLPKSYEPIAQLMHVEKLPADPIIPQVIPQIIPEAPVISDKLAENREDPILQMIKNSYDKNVYEPHSYKLGENMTQQNLTKVLSADAPKKELPDLTALKDAKDTKYYPKPQEIPQKPQDSLKKTDELNELSNSRESHNEIRKKRETDLLDAENCEQDLLDLVPGLLVDTLISRDLKSTKNVK